MEQFDMFVTVVQQQSLNKASQLLNISQPALSRKIMKLEQELGVELFRRKGKRLELTRAGEVCYEYALDQQRLERKLHDSLRAFRSATKPASIVIGASLTTLQSTLPDLITIYTREHPHTDIKAVTGKTHEVVPLVKEKKSRHRSCRLANRRPRPRQRPAVRRSSLSGAPRRTPLCRSRRLDRSRFARAADDLILPRDMVSRTDGRNVPSLRRPSGCEDGDRFVRSDRPPRRDVPDSHAAPGIVPAPSAGRQQ